MRSDKCKEVLFIYIMYIIYTNKEKRVEFFIVTTVTTIAEGWLLGSFGADFLAVFAPSVEPYTIATGKGVASSAKHLAYSACTKRVQALSVCVVGDIIGCSLFDDIKGRGVAFQFSLTRTERPDFLPALVIDIIPRLRGLDKADALCHHRHSHRHHYQTK